ncbi:MAG: hypothetical protein WCG21_11875 [Eubacteriales bacterium]
MAKLTSKNTKLQYDSSATEVPTWVEIPDVKTFPALIGDVDEVDTSVVTGDKTSGEGQASVESPVFKFAYSGQGAGTNFLLLNTTIGSGVTKKFRILYPDGSGFNFSATCRVKDEGFDGGSAPLEFSAKFFISSLVVPFATST